MAKESELETGNSVQALYLNNQYKARNGFAVDSGVVPSIDTGQLGDGEDTVEVTDGWVWYDQRPVEVSAQSTSIDSAGANPRKDVVAVNSGGGLEVVEGTPAEIPDDQQGASRFQTYRPSPPDLSDQDLVPVVEVWVPGGAADISDSDLNDIRAFESRLMLAAETTVTAQTGETPAVEATIPVDNNDLTQPLDVLVAPAGSSNPSLAFNTDWGRVWDDTNDELQVDLTVNWDTDPDEDVDLEVFVVQVNT